MPKILGMMILHGLKSNLEDAPEDIILYFILKSHAQMSSKFHLSDSAIQSIYFFKHLRAPQNHANFAS